MPSSNNCPKCQSPKRVRGVRFDERPHHGGVTNTHLEIKVNPETRFQEGAQRFTIEADVCGECGYIELFVQKPAELWRAVEEQNET